MIGTTWIELLIIFGLAAMQATHLVRKAEITAVIRSWMDKRLFTSKLLACGYCFSYWPSAAIWLLFGLIMALEACKPFCGPIYRIAIGSLQFALSSPVAVLAISRASNIIHDVLSKLGMDKTPEHRLDLSHLQEEEDSGGDAQHQV